MVDSQVFDSAVRSPKRNIFWTCIENALGLMDEDVLFIKFKLNAGYAKAHSSKYVCNISQNYLAFNFFLFNFYFDSIIAT